MRDLSTFFRPESVAVIGASKTPGKVGYAVLKNIIDSGYGGELYAVNPGEKEILGRKCVASVTEVAPVDLAVICVPAALAVKLAEECGQSGVKNLIVITAGFKEVGEKGAELEERLTAICAEYEMNMLGPNCLGLMDSQTPINASFASKSPQPGKIAFISQSGAMLTSILDWSLVNNIGFSKFVSLGNKADLSEIDLIEATADDPDTNVALLYIEDVINGRRFMEVARRTAGRVPILVLKSGKSEAGERAASSHTGALAGNQQAYRTAFRQTGILEVESVSELFTLAMAFSTGRMPESQGVAIVTNAGGPGIVTTDEVERLELEMAEFSSDTRENLKNDLPDTASLINPVDLIGDAPPERYRKGLENVVEDPGCGCIIILVTPQAQTNPEGVADVILDVHEKTEKPLLVTMMGGEAVAGAVEKLRENNVPCYNFPEEAVRAARGLYDFKASQRQFETETLLKLDPNPQKDTIEALFTTVQKEGRKVLLASETSRVAEAYGIPFPEVNLAQNRREAVEYAQKMSYPVVMKVASPRIVHKSDIGGVRLNITSAEEAEEAFSEIMEAAREHLEDDGDNLYGVEVQYMVDKGRELIIGTTSDPQFGPMLMFGLGGIYVNLMEDVSFRLVAELTTEQVSKMVRETKAYTLLSGFRGEKPCDIEAVEDIIVKTARLMNDFPDVISEIDINPLMAYPQGVMAVDFKMTLK